MSGKFSVETKLPEDARGIVRFILSDCAPEIVATTELLTSELVTNAILYGSDHAVLVVEVQQDRVRIEVHDRDRTTTFAPLQVKPTEPHGRGLAIVDALASSWGIELQDHGKAVWFDLDL